MRSVETDGDRTRNFIIDEAVRLASGSDASRGLSYVWQAIKNAGIRRGEEQTKWFQDIVGEVKERLDALNTRRELLKEAGVQDAAKHEREIDPRVPDDYIENEVA